MLEALLPRFRGLGRPDRIGDMADEHDAPLVRFVGDREVRIARDIGLDLDEVDTAPDEHVHRAASVVGRRHRDRRRELGLRAVEHWAGDHHPRPEHPLLGDRGAGPQDRFEVAPHVAHAGDAVGDEQWNRHRLASRDPVSEERVDVHVPQARDDELAGRVDHARTGGRRAGADVDDVVSADRHDLIRVKAAVTRIDHRDVCDRERWLVRRGRLRSGATDHGGDNNENDPRDHGRSVPSAHRRDRDVLHTRAASGRRPGRSDALIASSYLRGLVMPWTISTLSAKSLSSSAT